MLDSETAEQVENFNTAINERLYYTNFWVQHGEGGFALEDDYYLQKWDPNYGYNDSTAEECGASNGDTMRADTKDLNHDDGCYNKYIGVKLIIDKKSNNGGNLATVIMRATDEYGATIGQAHINPMLYTREFELELENGETDKKMANQIAAKFYSPLRYEGHEILKFKGIIDHYEDGYAITKCTGFTVLKGGHKK